MMPSIGCFRFSMMFLLVVLCSSVRAQPPDADLVKLALKDGNTAFTKGDYDAARRSFEKAWQIAQRPPANAPVRYDILKRLTATAAALGQFMEAQRYIQQALEWRVSIMGADDPRIADDLLLSINLDLRTKDFDQALSTARRLQAIHAAAHTAESTQVADDYLRIGQIYLAQRNAHDAIRAFAEADRLRTELIGALDPGLLPVLDGLNEAYGTLGATGAREPIYRQALLIRETMYGSDSTELINTIEGLADSCAAGGEYVAAEPLYERLLSLWERLVGPEHPMVAVTLDKLVVFYMKEGKPEKARAALARSVAIRARFLAVGLSHQAADQIELGRPMEAMALYNRALAALGSPGGANNDVIAALRKSLAALQKAAVK